MFLLLLFIWLFLFLLWDRVSLYSPGYPRIHYVDYAGFKLKKMHLPLPLKHGIKGVRHPPPSEHISFKVNGDWVLWILWVLLSSEKFRHTILIYRFLERSPLWVSFYLLYQLFIFYFLYSVSAVCLLCQLVSVGPAILYLIADLRIFVK